MVDLPIYGVRNHGVRVRVFRVGKEPLQGMRGLLLYLTFGAFTPRYESAELDIEVPSNFTVP